MKYKIVWLINNHHRVNVSPIYTVRIKLRYKDSNYAA